MEPLCSGGGSFASFHGGRFYPRVFKRLLGRYENFEPGHTTHVSYCCRRSFPAFSPCFSGSYTCVPALDYRNDERFQPYRRSERPVPHDVYRGILGFCSVRVPPFFSSSRELGCWSSSLEFPQSENLFRRRRNNASGVTLLKPLSLFLDPVSRRCSCV